MAGLYFHIPFCKRICAYCDFYKSVETARLPETLQAMHRELESRREYLGGEAVRTRYFGGGTPALAADRIKEIIDAIQENGGVTIGDEMLGRAVDRYNRKRAVINGGFA